MGNSFNEYRHWMKEVEKKSRLRGKFDVNIKHLFEIFQNNTVRIKLKKELIVMVKD